MRVVWYGELKKLVFDSGRYRYSALAVMLLVKAYSTPTPIAPPLIHWLCEPPQPASGVEKFAFALTPA